MTAEQLIREGKLEEALQLLQGEVRKAPENPKLRVFLFQLLVTLGQWDRALTQLNVAGELDVANLVLAQTYREVIRCEVLRKEIFSGHKKPLVFGEPAPWVALIQEALKLASENKFLEAISLREQAFNLAPGVSGTINNEPFNWVADADSRLGPILEAVINGKYYWIPFNQIKEIHIDAPVDLRDFSWMPVHFVWLNEGEAFGFIPSRYSGSENSIDTNIQLARKTEWEERVTDFYVGHGQRMLSTDVNDYPLFEIREIKVDSNEN